MHIRETFVSGFVTGGVGGATALYSALNYEIGDISNIGPGAAPTGLGVLLLAFGVGMLLQGLREDKITWRFPLRNSGFVMLALACFGTLIVPFGLFPAVAVGGTVGAFADRDNGPGFCVGLGLALAAMCTLLFIYALGLPIDALSWDI